MDILLLNQGHTDNFGDIAINQTMQKAFSEFNVFSVPFSTFSMSGKNNIDKLLKLFWLDRKNVAYFSNILLHMKNKPKAAIIGGGELFTANMNFNSAFVSWVKVLKRHGIPIFVYGISGNELNPVYSYRLKKGLKKCRYISVRDTKTLELFENVYSVNAEYYPDVVFANYLFNETTINCTAKKGIIMCNPLAYEYYLTSVSNKVSKEQYFKIWEDLIVKNKQGMIVHIGYTTEEDKLTAEEFYEYLKLMHSEWDLMFDDCLTLSTYWNSLENINCVISARMHALILGILKGCLGIPFCFKEKLSCFNEEYHEYLVGNKSIETITSASRKGLVKLAYLIKNEADYS